MGETAGDRGQRPGALADIPARGVQDSQPGAGRVQNTEHKRGKDSSGQEHLTVLARPAQEEGRRVREGADRRPRLWRPGPVRRPAVRPTPPVSAGRAGRGPPRQAGDRRTGPGPGAQQPLRNRRPRHGAVCPDVGDSRPMSKSWILVLGGGPVLRTSAPVWRAVTLVPLSGSLPVSSSRVRRESSACHHDKQGSPCPRSRKSSPISSSARSFSPFDRRLDELDLLDLRELRLRVALQAPPPDRSRASRRQALLPC